MKKKLISMMALLVLLIGLIPTRAEAASASGSSSLRSGNSVTVSFSVSGSNIKGVDATISYDSDHLTLQSIDNLAGGNWAFKQNGTTIVMFDTTGSGISGGNVFSASFTVNSGVAVGTNVWAKAVGETDENGGTSFSASWSATILPPLSGNCALRSLSCSNGTLSPAFSSGVYEYSMTVPFDVTSLKLSYSNDHSGASSSVSGNSLSVGANTVSITVKAENGSTRTYYIYVTREQDPNYVPSTDATLSELVPSAGSLSPAFDPATRKYVVYLPYETESIEINGTAADEKASGVAQAKSETLRVGANFLQVVCTAEDGTTTAAYQVQVVRMPVYAGKLPKITAPSNEPPKPVKPKEPTTMEIPLEIKLPYIGKVPTWALATAALVLLLVILFVPIWFWGRHSGKARILRKLDLPPDSAEKDSDDLIPDSEAGDVPADDGEQAPPEEEDTLPTDENPDGDAVLSEEEPSSEETPSDEDTSPEGETAAEEETPEEKTASEEESVEGEALSSENGSAAPETSDGKEGSSEKKISLTELLDDIHNM